MSVPSAPSGQIPTNLFSTRLNELKFLIKKTKLITADVES